jgi:23S rRNA pseudouridine1911/1915/1917 synthase
VSQPLPNTRLRLEIVHEDDEIVVANKAPGVVTEPGRSHAQDTLLNALVARYGGKLLRLGERRDYGLLHRLDRPTSGCVACALDPDAYDRVRAAFESRQVEKTYLALVRGRMRQGAQRIELDLEERRVPSREGTRLVSVVLRGAKPAVTEIEPLSTSLTHTLVSCRPLTGRLHQIRVHLAHLGFPIEGEPIYATGGSIKQDSGPSERPLGLHAWKLAFDNGTRRVDATAGPSRKFVELLERAGLAWTG